MAVIYSSVRELWAEEIANDSVVDGSFDSGDLIAAYKELLGMQRNKLDVDDEAILAVIRRVRGRRQAPQDRGGRLLDAR
jgi:hypothetical protein